MKGYWLYTYNLLVLISFAATIIDEYSFSTFICHIIVHKIFII